MEEKLIIGIDASRSNVAQKTGTEYYSYEIIKNLIKNNSRYYFRLYSKTELDYVGGYPNVENKVMKFSKLWSQVRLSMEILLNPPHVLFEPAHTIPIIHGRKTVVTLHDVGFRYFPELYTPLERIYHNWCMGFSIKHATKIIAISEATRDDLIKIYGADPKKITVIYHGYEKNKYYPLSAIERSPAWVEKMKPYVYFIGRLEAKKNLKNLVKAFGLLKKDGRVKHKLVLAGRPGYMYEEIEEEINSLDPKIRKDVIELGYVADDKVSSLMRGADIFAFPSKFEGFGMPLVEAMASGVPIVGSNTTSIPEITDKSALLSDPEDFLKLSENMKILITDKRKRQNLVNKGLKRAKDFNWTDAAHKTLEVLKKVANN